uniref:Uncharacterized protein n=1 Tax=Anguilla anguilla TaxID=7936 RepID=A0A0E9SK00_ANGAN
MPTTGSGSLVFIDDVTADRTATELILILSAQVASKYPQTHWTTPHPTGRQ